MYPYLSSVCGAVAKRLQVERDTRNLRFHLKVHGLTAHQGRTGKITEQEKTAVRSKYVFSAF